MPDSQGQLARTLIEAGIFDSNVSAALATQFAHYLTALPYYDSSEDWETIRDVRMDVNDQEIVTMAASEKLPNLRFRLGEFLLETAIAGTSVVTQGTDPVKLAIIGVRFLQRVKQLSERSISPIDAQILLAIVKLKNDSKIVTIDQLHEVLPDRIDANQIAASLSLLEQLSCITIDKGTIRLIEVVIVRRPVA